MVILRNSNKIQLFVEREKKWQRKKWDVNPCGKDVKRFTALKVP
jgi:hypothetical protein